VGIFFPNNIYLSNYHFTHREITEKSIIRPYDRWVVLCTVKDLTSISIFLTARMHLSNVVDVFKS
jgi:hypothetical protein